MDLREHLDLALELADTADAITVERFRATDLRVDTKPDLTPVTEADRAVEQALRAHLAEAAAGHSIFGEEYGTDGDEAAEFRWIIDPIDGTKNYVRGVPVWATLVGLERAGEMVVGVVSAPALHARWWAARGLGAYRDGEPIRVSAVHALADAHLSFGWDTTDRFEGGGFGERALALARRCWRTRALGDFWQHVLVAEGAFDISLEPACAVWDLAPLQVIVEEAGGRFSDLAGERTVAGGNVVCTNGVLHDAVLDALR